MNSQSAVLADKDFDNRKSFITLYDQTRIIHPPPQTGALGMKWNFNLKFPKSCQLVNYVNAGTSVSQNELFIGFLQENDLNVTINNHYRLYYTDP